MGIFILMIVGILLFTITVFVHKNTYTTYDNERLSLPVWLLILMLSIALIPGVNLLAFIVGVAAYLANITAYGIEFNCEAKWWKSLIGFLCKEV